MAPRRAASATSKWAAPTREREMLTKEHAQEIFATLRKHCSADEIELSVGGGISALTRFANNTIHQNVADENYSLSVRVNFGGRTARATTNKMDDASLQRVVQQAEALARVQEADADLPAMPSPEEVAEHATGLPETPPSRY